MIALAGLLFAQFCLAQDFVLGRDELANVDVYSLLQTQDGTLYAATDNGLYAYRHGKFEQVPGPKGQIGSSLFNLKTDKKGKVHCYNLNGQVFRLERDSLVLAFSITRPELGQFSNYEFEEDNHLIFGSRSLLRVSEDGKVVDTLTKFGNLSSCFELTSDGQGKIYVGASYGNSLGVIKDGKFISIPPICRTKGYALESSWPQVMLNGELLMLGPYGGAWGSIDKEIQYLLPPLPHERFVEISSTEVMGMSFQLGARSIKMHGDTLLEVQKFFPHKFISACTAGPDGTLFFGTFGQGVMMVPNRQAKSIEIPGMQGHLRGLCTDGKGGVYVGTQAGQLFQVGEQAQLLTSYSSRPLVFLANLAPMDHGLDSKFPYLLSPALAEIGSLKDVCMSGDTAALVASSIGLMRIGAPPLDLEHWAWMGPTMKNIWKLKAAEMRCQAIAEENGQIFFAVTDAIYRYDGFGKKTKISPNGGSISCNDLLAHKGRLAVATQGKGLLVLQGQEVKLHLDESNGLLADQVHKLALWRDQLVLGTQAGLQMVDTSSGEIRNLGMADGIIPGAVRDFVIDGDQLWAVVKNELYSLNLNQLSPAIPPLDWRLDSLLLGGNAVQAEELPINLPYNGNWIDLHLDYRQLAYLEEAKYKYRLEGMDDNWQFADAKLAHIGYKSLPAGKYDLQIQLLCKGHASPISHFPFVVKAPFWQQWWFFLICALLISAGVAGFFGLRISRIRRENADRMQRQLMEKKLVESRLKALRSQMNPHFIFNSLNSIQDLILRQDTDRAYDYVVMFAELVRSTLNYSNQDFIPIEKELEFLGVYLGLEQLRFKEDLHYDIQYHGDPDIQVPSMVVQPFIENALLHGLLHKTGAKHIEVSFELNEGLVCRVKDNGVGRAKAKEIKDRQGGRHESFSLGAIRQRLEILHEQYGEEVGYSFTDLYEDGQPSGTLVEIKMAFKRMF